MPETSLNEKKALTTVSKSNADMKVDNGDIVDNNGNSVTIGTVDSDEIEQSFGVTHRGVSKVKGASPTGNLQTDTNGNIVVEGYGTVTLEGPLREVSSAGNTNGNQVNLKSNSSGNIRATYKDWVEYQHQKVVYNNDTSTNLNVNSVTIDGSQQSWASGYDYKINNVVVGWGVDEPGSSGEEYTVAMELLIDVNDDGSFTSYEAGQYTKTDDYTDGMNYGNFLTGYPSFQTKNMTAKVRPHKDNDSDGVKEYLSGPAVESDNAHWSNVSIDIEYYAEQDVTRTISLY